MPAPIYGPMPGLPLVEPRPVPFVFRHLLPVPDNAGLAMRVAALEARLAELEAPALSLVLRPTAEDVARYGS